MANTKNTILQKLMNGTLYELLIRTNSSLVKMTSGETLDSVLEKINTDLTNAKETLTTLVGEDEATSITGKINAAISALTNEEDANSLAGKIATINSTVLEMTDSSTGILVTAKGYTDQVVGLKGTAYTTVKEYVDSIQSTINQAQAGALHFRGTVDYVKDLPAVDESAKGDVYQVRYSGSTGENVLNAEYASNGTEWVELGSVIDLSAYYTSAQVTAAINNAFDELKSAIDDIKDESNPASIVSRLKAVENKNTTLTEQVESAQSAAENATIAIEARPTFYVSETQPENLKDGDLWLQIVDDTTE